MKKKIAVVISILIISNITEAQNSNQKVFDDSKHNFFNLKTLKNTCFSTPQNQQKGKTLNGVIAFTNSQIQRNWDLKKEKLWVSFYQSLFNVGC